MQTISRVLNIFLASPDDVKEERIAAEDVISDLDKIIGGTLGWNIRLHKWEDTAPGFGRPQAIINAAVDSCDLFIGLLWERWGQPTGNYSSGFEEEYERACCRRKETQTPEIWMAFKTIDQNKLNDPGSQLVKVREFKQRLTNENELKYGQVKDLDDWKRKLKNWLYEYILKLHTVASQPPQGPASSPQPTSLIIETTQSEPTSEKRGTPRQLVEVAESLTKVVKSGELEFSNEDAKLLGEFDIARLYLASATWMFSRYTSDTLRTHEVNLLYKHRRGLRATPGEILQFFRAIIVDASIVIPGWYWFSKMNAEVLRNSLLSISIRDSSDEVRKKALQLLHSGSMKLSKKLWPILPLYDPNEWVRVGALEYLGSVGVDRALPLLEEIAGKDNTIAASAAREAKLSILFRTKSLETASAVIKSSEYLADVQISKLIPLLPDIGEEVLLKGGENQWEGIRKLCVTELIRRGRLPSELAEKLSEDPSVAIREIAFIELARRSQKLDFDKVRKALSNEVESKNHLANLLGG
jgi:hypothetical protein